MKKINKLSKTNIFDIIKNIIIEETGISEYKINDTINLKEMGNDIDSLDLIAIITTVEEYFDLHLPDNRNELMILKNLVEYIYKNQ